MYKAIRILGLIAIAKGFLIVTYGKDFLKAWRTPMFGDKFSNTIDAYLELPEKTLKIGGFVAMLVGATWLLFGERAEEGMKEKA
jgi:uncharacterized protein YjeT (DUF2065 family)